MKEHLYDVVAVNMETNKVRLLAENKTIENAEAIVNMAVMRRGLDEEFYAECVAGKYVEGDNYSKGES